MTTAALRTRLRWRQHALVWIAGSAAAVAIGMYAHAPRFPGGAGARAYPRMPSRAPDLATLLYQLGVGSVVWYSAAVTVPAMVLVARTIDIERLGRVKTAAIAVLTVLTLTLFTALFQYAITFDGAPSRPGTMQYLPTALRENLVPWLVVASLVTAYETRRRALRSIVERERLRAEVAEQRLIALTGQLHPHFLFNTLQGISTLIHRDPDAADEMLAKLSDLLRDVLAHRESVLVSLGDELRSARTYLDIAQIRFADRLQCAIDVAPELHSLAVPLFILQPLVENALAHGIGARAAGGRITVRAWRASDRLHLEVSDDGAGVKNGAPRERIGLGNTRARLGATFGDDYTFTLRPGAEGGAIAHIDMPCRPHLEARAS